MKRVMLSFLGLLFAATLVLSAVLSGSAGSVNALAAEKGQRLFESKRCNMCHDVSTVGIEATTKAAAMKGPDLVGIDQEVDWIVQFVKKEVELEGKKHRGPYSGSDEDLRAIAEWIAAQKKE